MMRGARAQIVVIAAIALAAVIVLGGAGAGVFGGAFSATGEAIDDGSGGGLGYVVRPAVQVAAIEFVTYDVVVETGDEPLAAYQVEVTLPEGALLSGVEGGAGVFAEPPAYDQRVLHGNERFDRVVLAAFVRGDAEPMTGVVRVARLHVMAELAVDADAPAFLATRLIAAGSDEYTRTAPSVRTKRVVASDAEHESEQHERGGDTPARDHETTTQHNDLDQGTKEHDG